MEKGTETTGVVNHHLEMQDEKNDWFMCDVEVSQDSIGSGATLGESLHNLEVEIRIYDGTRMA